MGACMSSTSDSITTIQRSTSAFVISIDGELHHYPTPIFVSELLQFENPSSVSSFFVCNSDNFNYDQLITGLRPESELDAGQIYFVLPKKMLGRRLGASDMAALAVKASVALDSNAQKQKNKARISPLMAMESGGNVGNKKQLNLRGSMRKGGLGVGLSTIYENEGCDI